MHYEVRIDPKLFDTYPDIRLGLIRFQADIQPPDAAFWAYLDAEILPQVRAALEGREWSQVPGVRGSRAAYKALAATREDTASPPKRCSAGSAGATSSTLSIPWWM